MFLEVDSIIFPDCCEVIQVASQQFVYPIFKCGRSSLTWNMESRGWTFVPEQDINKIVTPIKIFLRDPRDRFLSGVNTYMQHLAREGNELDQHTVLYFVNRYLFLNRHYAPQFFWLLNLARFSRPDTLVTFSPMTEINQLTDANDHAGIAPLTDVLREKINSFNWSKLELYLYLDQILIDHIDKIISIQDLIKHVQTNHSELYKLVFQPTLNITNVLSKT
jgi:hypothetical protein